MAPHVQIGHDRGIGHEHASNVTVVIVAWDSYARDFLAGAVASVAAQKPKPAILIVDNASVPMVDGRGLTVIRSQERLSVGRARNFGLDAVQTPYVMFWDADDVMLPGTIRRLLDAMSADAGLAVAGTRILEDDRTYHHWPRLAFQRLARWPAAYAALHAVSSLYATTGSMMRTDLLRAGGGFPDINEGDDWVVGVSMALRGRVRVLEHPGRIYHLHADSVSARWTTADRLRSAHSVRRRLRSEPALPAGVRAAITVMAPAHWLVLLVLRPLRLRLRSLAGARVVAGDVQPVEARL